MRSINHTGPRDGGGSRCGLSDWVRNGAQVRVYKDYPTTVDCTLVDNLPDFLTDL